ncbi:unnamed protein product, partial [Clonostachys rosea f. rosea IK726]
MSNVSSSDWYSRVRSLSTALILVWNEPTIVSIAFTAASRFLENPGSRLPITSRDGNTCLSMSVLLLDHSRPQSALSLCHKNRNLPPICAACCFKLSNAIVLRTSSPGQVLVGLLVRIEVRLGVSMADALLLEQF